MNQKNGMILVVDDNRMSRLKLSRSLEQHGYRVVVAENGPQALRKLHEQPFDLVFLDCLLPGMNGDQVLIAMQNETALKRVPVIMIASPQDEAKIDTYLAMGAVDYIPQAFDTTALKAHIEAHLHSPATHHLDSQSVILVVDDDEVTRLKLARTLKQQNYKVYTAINGKQALEIVKIRAIDLILLDILMPGIDGFETCRRLMSDVTTCEIPVIFMTALTEVDDKVKGFELGAVDYITKPIQPKEMLARVNTHLRLRRLTGRLKDAYAREQQRRQLSDTLREVAKIVSSTLQQEQVFDLILTQLEKVIIYHRASIILLEGENLRVVAARSDGGKVSDATVIPVGHYPLNEIALREKRPILIPDTNQDKRWQSENYPIAVSSFITAPLIVQDRPIGLLGVSRADGNAYTEDDSQTVFAFALQVAMAVENTRLMQQTQIELTERKRAEEALQQVNQELTKLNTDKDRFFSILAHDLKGPFMPLMGNLQLLKDSADEWNPEEIALMTGSMYRSAGRVLSLLESVLEWARLQMGRMEYTPNRLNLTDIVEKNIQLMMDNALRKELHLVNRLKPLIFVEGDRDMLNTVVRNLISNAIKFTPEQGQVVVTAARHAPHHHEALPEPSENHRLNLPEPTSTDSACVTPHQEAGCTEFVAVSVQDTGVGMNPAEIDKLFKIDKHFTTPGTAQEQGTGLGLMICQEMIHRHGGTIWADSEVGQGTTFTFTVPWHTSTPLPENGLTLDEDLLPPRPVHHEPLPPIPPPPTEMTILLDLAMQGNLIEFKQRIAVIEGMNEQYSPFAHRLRQLANNFEDEAIIKLLNQYIAAR